MSASVNKVILLGRLGADPEMNYVGDRGSALTKFSVATDRRWKSGDDWKTETQWTRVLAWGKLAEACKSSLGKGQQVYVEGRLQTSSYTPPDSEKPVYTTAVVARSVVFLARPSGARPPTPEFDAPEIDAPFGDGDLPF